MPVRQREPAGFGAFAQSLSFLQAEVDPPPSGLPRMATHDGTPFEPVGSAQTRPDGQPALEQSPAWHLLSAPQVSPFAQSAGFAHAPLGGVVLGVPSVNLQTFALLQV